MQRPILTVSEINRYIKDILSNNIILGNVLIRGEISNYKYHYSGHMYFTLKDEMSSLKCVMFKGSCINLKFDPQDGMKVIIQGRISVYERDGSYQLYAEEMQPDGVGALHLAFEQLKAKLEKEGLFDEKLKKPIPFLPKAVGVVTSPTGAAVRDILNVIGRRFYSMKVIIYPVQVQGEGAAEQIAQAIQNFNKLDNVDVIIVGRGGGSIEELWAFNEEIVARSIAFSKIPVISAVGHETDFTIADFVSDLRAPTPSAAAELAVPGRMDIQATLRSLVNRASYAMQSNVSQKRNRLENVTDSSVLRQPLDKIYQHRLRLDIIEKGIVKEIRHQFKNKKLSFGQTIAKFSALSPLNILQRGYCVSKDSNGKTVKSIKQLKVGDKVRIQYYDGEAECSVDNLVNN